jgi:RHS repeat-associated protein
MKADGTVVQNVYDVDGVLVRTTVTPAGGAAVATNYLVDTTGALSHVVAEIRGGNLQKTYVRAGDMLLAELEGMPGGGVRYYEIEGIGSVRSLLDNGGNTTDTWRYTAFGEQLARTGTSTQAFQFAGERFVGTAGLYQNRARWLDVGSASFVSVDPRVGETESPYRYADSDPVGDVDPSGEFTLPQISIGIVAVGIVAATCSGCAAPVSLRRSSSTRTEADILPFYIFYDFSGLDGSLRRTAVAAAEYLTRQARALSGLDERQLIDSLSGKYVPAYSPADARMSRFRFFPGGDVTELVEGGHCGGRTICRVGVFDRATQFDTDNIALHEFGHDFGVHHSSESNNVMFTPYSIGKTRHLSFSENDKRKIRSEFDKLGF